MGLCEWYDTSIQYLSEQWWLPVVCEAIDQSIRNKFDPFNLVDQLTSTANSQGPGISVSNPFSSSSGAQFACNYEKCLWSWHLLIKNWINPSPHVTIEIE